MELLIEARNAGIKYGTVTVLEGINLKIPLAKTSFILGPAGSGKTTLLKALSGLLPVDEGEILVSGVSYRAMSDRELQAFRAYSGFVFQDAALWANQNVLNNVLLPLKYHQPYYNEAQAVEKAREIFRAVGFEKDPSLRPSDISQGEQKLVSFARALIMDPLIYFMDSPLSLVDAGNVKKLLAVVRDLKKAAKTLVIVSNRLDFCCETADYVTILQDGKIHSSGALADVVSAWPDFMEEINAHDEAILKKRGIRLNKEVET